MKFYQKYVGLFGFCVEAHNGKSRGEEQEPDSNTRKVVTIKCEKGEEIQGRGESEKQELTSRCLGRQGWGKEVRECV